MAAPAPHSPVAVTEEERAEYTRRIVVQLDQIDDAANKNAAARAAFLEGEGTQRLDLSAITKLKEKTTMHTPTFLSMLLAELVPPYDTVLLEALITSVERFGYPFENQFEPGKAISNCDSPLHSIMILVSRSGGLHDIPFYERVAHLCRQLLVQPSCTDEIVGACSIDGAGSCLVPLLKLSRLEVLSLASTLQRRIRLQWDRWMGSILGVKPQSMEFILRFLLVDDGCWEGTPDMAPQYPSLLTNHADLCAVGRLFGELKGRLVARPPLPVAETRAWIEQKLHDFPEISRCSRLCYELVGIDPKNEFLNLVRERPEALRLDETNSSNRSLITGLLSLSFLNLRFFGRRSIR